MRPFLCVLALAMLAGGCAQSGTPAKSVKWEYKRLDIAVTGNGENLSMEEFNKLGEEGWELVAVRGGSPTVKSYPPEGGPVNYQPAVFYFKRPK